MLHENDPDPNENPGRRKNKARYEMHARMINAMPASRKGNCGAIPQIRRRGALSGVSDGIFIIFIFESDFDLTCLL